MLTRVFSSENDSQFCCFKNVQEYSCLESTEYSWQITYEKEEEPVDSSVPIYFILDSANQNAFSHWVYENATWLPLFLTIREKHPSCKLVLHTWKEFKKLYLNFYGVSLSDVCLQTDITTPNYCFFHTYISLNDLTIPDIYYTNLLSYKEKIDTHTVEKDIPILYLPRGNKENLQGPNDRIYNIQDNLKKLIVDLSGVVYETDKTQLLDEQINIVRRSKMIILDYGSNLWVNGCFAKDSMILCLTIGWEHHILFPSYGFVWNYINSENSLRQVFAQYTEPIFIDNTAVVSFDYKGLERIILDFNNP